MITQDQINEKMISLVIKGNKITAQLLYKALKKLLAELEKQGKKMVGPKTYKGKQSVKDLVRQGAGVTNIEITDANIGSFEPYVQPGIFASCPKNIFQKTGLNLWHFPNAVVEGSERGKPPPAYADAKGGENMDEPARSQWQIRCAFNAFCKRTLEREAINAHKQVKRRQLREVTFSDLAPQEENQLYTLDTYFENEAAEAFNVGGKKITPKLLTDALHSLPEDKRKAVLLYYFMEMSDVEIGKLLDIPRSTVQYRRTSSFELLKRYLEEHADEWEDW